MARHFADWIDAYCHFTRHLEAPTNIHFFAAVQALGGALRRQVWFDQGYFNWYPNQYVIIVAKPGIVNKSTSIGVAMDLLREVPGIHMGPASITWQALIQAMGNVAEQVEIAGEFHTQSCLTFVASELGTLIDFHNREMIDVLVDLWDGKTGSWEKMSKASGKETIVNPWIALTAGTTPAWLAANVPEAAVGGGFTSRCIFVYGKEKRHLCAYPKRNLDKDFFEYRQKLISDLEHISLLKGEYTLTTEAQAYGEVWYERLWNETPENLRGPRYEGYLARKQTHVHKLAMIFAAARRDELTIGLEEFALAENLLTSAEDDMAIALDKIGKAEVGQVLDKLEEILQKGPVEYYEVVRLLTRFCHATDTKQTLDLAHQAGVCRTEVRGSRTYVILAGHETV